MDPSTNEPRQNEGNNEEDDLRAASNSMGTYSQTTPPPEKHLIRNIILAVLALAALAALAAGVYSKFIKKTSQPAGTAETAQTQTSAQKPAAQITAETSQYDSDNFSLSFSYPKDWTVTDKPGSGVLTAVSPEIQLTGSDGQSVKGRVVMKIRDRNQKLTEFDKGNALAVSDSVKIAYTKPTQTQRGSTYVSFLQYAGSDSGLDGVYITGDSGYQKDQAIPLVDVSKVEPVVSITFQDGAGKTLTISSDMWNNSSFSAPLLNMLKSLSIT